MKFNRILLAASSAAALAIPFSASVQAAAPAAKIINGKPCTPVPGGSAKLGIQLYSIPGLLTGTATSVDQAEQEAMARAAAAPPAAPVVLAAADVAAVEVERALAALALPARAVPAAAALLLADRAGAASEAVAPAALAVPAALLAQPAARPRPADVAARVAPGVRRPPCRMVRKPMCR